MRMKRIALLLALLVGAFAAKHYIGAEGPRAFETLTGSPPAAEESQSPAGREPAPAQFRDGAMIEGAGVVMRLLPDDRDGSAHQRFILRLPSGRTLLVAHNIDLAPRIDALRVGDIVEFHGEFANNPQGGVVHWTHHDPQGRHPAGWLRHQGRTYQ